jgi:hypothetical protein
MNQRTGIRRGSWFLATYPVLPDLLVEFVENVVDDEFEDELVLIALVVLLPKPSVFSRP